MQTTTTTAITHDPLETLVIAQIGALREFEADLKRQMTQPGATENIAPRIHSLRVRAERLNRMIDAMAVGGTFAESVFVPQAA